jgi:uncharacterized repeat protein (TIGR01451 family)
MTTSAENKSSGFMRSAFSVIALTALWMMAITLIVQPGMANASTMAGTSVVNTVTATYKGSAGGTTFTSTGSVTVTVSLVKSAPIIAFISEDKGATALTPTDEATVVTQTYSIYATNNGPVQYTVNALGSGTTFTATTIGLVGTVTPQGPFYLGATTVAYPAASAQAVIYVPFDGTNDSIIGGLNGITAASKLWINNAVFSITTINENTAGDGGLPTDLQGKFAKITLASNLTAALSPGTIIGEYKTFTEAVTTGTFAAAQTTGSYTGSLTVTDGTNTSAPPAASTIYVERANLTIQKDVSFDNGATWNLGTGGPYPTTPGKDLTYRITVTNPSTIKTVNTVSLQDALSPYTAFKLASFTFTPNTSGLTYPASATTIYYDQANVVYTPVSAGGGAPAGYDAIVSSFNIAFTGQTMAVNSSCQLVYHVYLY